MKHSARKKARPPSSHRRRALREWRGVDLEAIELERRDTSRVAENILPGVLRELRMDQRLAEAEILRVWNHLIDPNVAAHAHPTGLRNGTLFVAVDNNVWLSEIVRYRRKEIIDRLQHSFGREMIARISFRIG